MQEEGIGLLGSMRTMSNISKYTSLFANWGKFATLFMIGAIIIVMSLPFSTFMLINPKPFCMLFSLGSVTLLVAILQIVEISQLLKKAGSFVASIIYLSSLGISLYAGLISIGYTKTILVILAQIISLVYLLISQFPGGQKGMSLVASQTKKTITGTIRNLVGLKENSFLPL